ncbi:MAG: ribosomal RNA small subunit methyltransferase A [Candidatus Edwardsbacteria bacterium]|nr:ribosomal RNA small subunit methyltransferase A [Candidatus Edwardsbacteria bacterium]MBU1575676.1 ribosomal RNA small subunit methyltransferase A [Candidatus Edwardsbacteria bacterium]MBU2463767.1 ribosomal RNA small subunit methyltransferase A [Candidatus Edwardsbacteria bacterium]MBU2594068.1 ribosomal RNA small subunit methyltransferase A [Candidatus Edwardsbacteria bacterium]
MENLIFKKSLAPKKKYGQNFLTSPAVAEKIVTAAELKSTDTVLEIGPGKGVLTSLMTDRCRKIWAVEIDPRLVETLSAMFGQSEKIKIVNQDILQYDLDEIIKESGRSFKVVANLPYNITVPILEKLIESRQRIASIIVMVQKEMADRLSAKPGSKDYGSLSIFIQYHLTVEKLFNVLPGSFFPKPKITSSVIKLTPHKMPPVILEEEGDFFDFVRLCFSQRRKMLRSVLKQHNKWEEEISNRISAEMDLTRRAETLNLNEFVKLYNILKAD